MRKTEEEGEWEEGSLIPSVAHLPHSAETCSPRATAAGWRTRTGKGISGVVDMASTLAHLLLPSSLAHLALLRSQSALALCSLETSPPWILKQPSKLSSSRGQNGSRYVFHLTRNGYRLNVLLPRRASLARKLK